MSDSVSVPSYSDYLSEDTCQVPEFLLAESPGKLSDRPLEAERYTSPEYFILESKRLWPRVWQMVCRLEDLPNVGDALPYDIVGHSFLIVRTDADTLRGYYNSCPHRGRKLLLEPSHLENLRCPFHGFSWHLDGSVRRIPCQWDFKHVPEGDFRLREVRLESWGGFVFLNMDDSAAPLSDWLGPLPTHFDRWRLDERYKAVHVGKVIQCNWKIAQEAFMESYHVIATHPQILEYCADANSRYDILSANVNRNLTAFGAPSPHLGATVTNEETLRGLLALHHRSTDTEPPGAPRAVAGGMIRDSFAKTYGGDWSDACDAELLDAIVYNVFPNFSPWGGFTPNIVYRWRPNGMDVNSCLMEVLILKPIKAGAPRPKPVSMRLLGSDERWTDVQELPILGGVIEQDMSNMPYVQDGLRASGSGKVHLAHYQESRIRHFHLRFDEFLREIPSNP